MNVSKVKIWALAMTLLIAISSCGNDDNGGQPSVKPPATYKFERNGKSTVSFTGQTTRHKMAMEMLSRMKVPATTEAALKAMFAHEQGNNNFTAADLNSSDKSVKSKTAASKDFFSGNTSEAAKIKRDFDSWLEKQVSEVFPKWRTVAEAGMAGQIADGSKTRYIDARGLEFDQAVNKGLIGALIADQALNNYLSKSVLEKGNYKAENDKGTVATGKSYTSMEHMWDEAYGYVYGVNETPENPNKSLGKKDKFLEKYIARVDSDPDFKGTAKKIFDAFKLGRAAIVAKNYTVRDQQADIIREEVSKVIAVRAIYYLQQGKEGLKRTPKAYGPAFHDLSEGFGFIYSLRFTRKPKSNAPYFTKAEVDSFIQKLIGDTNGFWTVAPATLDEISNKIAAKFDAITVAKAGS